MLKKKKQTTVIKQILEKETKKYIRCLQNNIVSTFVKKNLNKFLMIFLSFILFIFLMNKTLNIYLHAITYDDYRYKADTFLESR